jgi:Tfp pilus assembly protein PilO
MSIGIDKMRILSSNWFILVGVFVWILAICALFQLVWNPFYTGDHKVNGQQINNSKLYEQMMKPNAKIDNLKMQMDLLQSKKESLENMVNYCFQHADHPNPLQDLIDKGLMSSNMTGLTCVKVKQMISDLDNKISVIQTEINYATAKKECKYIPTENPAVWDKVCPNDPEYGK